MSRIDPSVVPATHVAGTTPYPWPWNGDLDPRGTAVVVVAEGGIPNPGAAGEHARRAAEVVEVVRAAGGVVVRTETTPPAGAALPSGPADPAGPAVTADHVVRAAGIDAFFGSPFEALLRSLRIERLVLVGTGLETSVHSTMRSANDRGFECLLVVDACTPHDPALVAASVSMIEMSGGIFGAVGSSRAVVAAFTEQRREKR